MSGDSSRTNQTVQNEAVFKLVGIVQLLQLTGLEWRKKAGQEVDRKRCALGLNVSSKSHRYSANSATAAIRCDCFFFFKEARVLSDLSSIPAMLWLEEFHTGAGPRQYPFREGSKKAAVFPSMVCFVSPEGSDTQAQVGPNQDSH